MTMTKPNKLSTTSVSLLTTLDISLSHRLHNTDTLVLSCILYPFAAFFHPKLIWLAFVSIYYVTNSISVMLVYIISTLLCLLTTTLLKRLISRYSMLR